MSFRDHVIAALLAAAVMAVSLVIPHGPELATPELNPAPTADAAQGRR